MAEKIIIIREPFKTKKEVISFFREYYKQKWIKTTYIADNHIDECWESVVELIPPEEFNNYVMLGLFGQDISNHDYLFSDNYALNYAYTKAQERLEQKKKNGHK